MRSHLSRTSTSLKERFLWALPLLCAVAAALRLYGLGRESIWWDEGFSIWVARMGFLGMLKTVAAVDFNPPLYYALLQGWIRLFGDSEFAVRSLSALFGVLSVAALYVLGSRIFSRTTGALAALFLSISGFQIYYSQEARGFTLMLFLAILSFYFFVEVLKSRNSIHSLGYIASSALLLYTHAFGLFMIGVQWSYLASLLLLSPEHRSDPEFRTWVTSSWAVNQLALVALSSPWFFLLIKKIIYLRANIEHAGAWSIQKPSVMEPVATLALFAGTGFALAVFAVLLIAVVLMRVKYEHSPQAVGALLPSIPKSEDFKLLLILEWLLIPIVLAFIASLVAPSIYKSKYLIGSSPAFYVLFARALTAVKHKAARGSLIVLTVALALPGLWAHYGSLHKEPWRRVAADIEANAKPGDLILFYPGTAQKLGFDYYAKRKDLIKVPFPKKGSFVNEDNVRELKSLRNKYSRIWVVEYHPDEKELIRRTLEKPFRVAGKGDYPYIKVYFFIKRL